MQSDQLMSTKLESASIYGRNGKLDCQLQGWNTPPHSNKSKQDSGVVLRCCQPQLSAATILGRCQILLKVPADSDISLGLNH